MRLALSHGVFRNCSARLSNCYSTSRLRPLRPLTSRNHRVLQTTANNPTCVLLQKRTYCDRTNEFSYTTETMADGPTSPAPQATPQEPLQMRAAAPKNAPPQINLKTPKGTRDIDPKEMAVRQDVLGKIENIFKSRGVSCLSTPAFELKEILASKFGEDEKLIYDLQDQGGELCSLRYDMTIPLARYVAMNPNCVPFKRYAMGPVWRRDAPIMSKGRYREFWQCDLDICGDFDAMIPEAEILKVVCDVFKTINFTDFTIKLNNRQILDGMFRICGVPEAKIRSTSSSIDKMDKLPWTDVRKEMTEEKGLDGEVADKIEKYVKVKGSMDEVITTLRADETLMSDESTKKAVDDMALLSRYLRVLNVLPRVSLDMSLARGLDYYTGVIYEIISEESISVAPTSQQKVSKKQQKKAANGGGGAAGAGAAEENEDQARIGSIAAGGRYDNLVGQFTPGKQVPCVGISFGIERICTILYKRQLSTVRPTSTEVYVLCLGGKDSTGMLEQRLELTTLLRDAGVKTEFTFKEKPRYQTEFKNAEKAGIPWVVMVAEEEWKEGVVNVKSNGGKDERVPKEGKKVKMQELGDVMKALLAGPDVPLPA